MVADGGEPRSAAGAALAAPKRRRVVVEVDDAEGGGAAAAGSDGGRGVNLAEAQLKVVQKELRAVRQQMADLRTEEARLAAEEGQLSETLAAARAEQTRAEAAAQDWGSGFAWDAAAKAVLRDRFGHRVFRPLQREAVNAVLNGNDAFAVMPTGSGKSLCYQLPAALWSSSAQGVASEGSTLVISPLLALIHDQVQSMRARGVDARMLNSDTDKDARRDTLNALGAGKVTLVYATPEFLAKSKMLLSKLQQAWKAQRLRLIAVDEAHCCSQWGHEFRPDYLKLKILRENFPTVPILALTATATETVQRDVEAQLGIRGCLLLRGRYNRPNLFYAAALKPERKEDELLWLAKFILSRHAGHSGLVYCLSCKDVDQTAEALATRGVRAVAYHAQRLPAERQAAYTKWSKGDADVVVATIAFGMGIDKPDVRFVVHQSMPKSVENYYQESGRAGRDGAPADCVLLYRPADVQRLTAMAAENVNRERNVRLVYEMLLCVDPPGGLVCRRKALAKYFGDTWQPEDCAGLCDACHSRTAKPSSRAVDEEDVVLKDLSSREAPGASTDASALAAAVLRMVAAAVDSPEGGGDRLTLLKAADAARSDAATARRLRGGAAAEKACRAASPRDIERVLARLLAQEYLSEEFVFNAYSANGYLRLTEKGRAAAAPGAAAPALRLLALPTAEALQLPPLASGGPR